MSFGLARTVHEPSATREVGMEREARVRPELQPDPVAYPAPEVGGEVEQVRDPGDVDRPHGLLAGSSRHGPDQLLHQ